MVQKRRKTLPRAAAAAGTGTAKPKPTKTKATKEKTPEEQNGNNKPTEEQQNGDKKPKGERSRTGCLTCRERHMRCDEREPKCFNCYRSKRDCARGIRLNFSNKRNVFFIPKPALDIVTIQRAFIDETESVMELYAVTGTAPPPAGSSDRSKVPERRQRPSLKIKKPRGPQKLTFAALQSISLEPLVQRADSVTAEPTEAGAAIENDSADRGDPFGDPFSEMWCTHDGIQSEQQEYLEGPKEAQCMQAFAQDIGVWMDCFNGENLFSQSFPHESLRSTILFKAALACGAKLVASKSKEMEHWALVCYSTASTNLLLTLGNPDRNTKECAVASVLLNMYEIMSDTPSKQMDHESGSRLLVHECGWDGKSRGIGAACFWLRMGLETLNCLSANTVTSWPPEEWGVDMSFTEKHGQFRNIGREDEWLQRILFIMAKAVNFRATSTVVEAYDQRSLLGNRLPQWQSLKRLCDFWNDCCPRTMHPLGYVPGSIKVVASRFPRIWMVTLRALQGRIFYHLAQILLAMSNPIEPVGVSNDMAFMRLHHAQQICGILANSEHPGLVIAGMRALPVAGAALVDREEQAELLSLLRRFYVERGPELRRIEATLKASWGWKEQCRYLPLSPREEMKRESYNGGLVILPGIQQLLAQTAQLATPPSGSPETATLPKPESFSPPYKGWYERPTGSMGLLSPMSSSSS